MKYERQRGPGLFDRIETTGIDWKPEAPRPLDGMQNVRIDFETSGLKWWEDHRPLGAAVYYEDGYSQYYPWGHQGGGNLSEEVMKEWFRREVRGKRITNQNTRFEVHQAREWGIDLEAQGNTVADVSHFAALLDDHRRTFNLEDLCRDFLPDFVDDRNAWKVARIDKSRMKEYHAGQVAAGAIQDVQRVVALEKVMWERMTIEDLHRVRKLEEDLIYVVCEMEKNASPLDVALLKDWRVRAQRELEGCLWSIYRETGLRVSPGSSKDIKKLFDSLGLPITEFTEAGAPSFTDAVLKRIDHPVITSLRRAAKLSDLLSDYLIKYDETVKDDGLLRYALHQLRTDTTEGNAGTISGRFSSGAIKISKSEKVGANIQQVFAVEKQADTYGEDYLIRQLFVPKSGRWLSADAKQIELRLFAHYANSPAIIKAYQDDPDLSFHDKIYEMLLPFKPDLGYKPLKNMNFAQVYGAGLIKIGVMMGHITEREGQKIRMECEEVKMKHSKHPALAQTALIKAIYNREIPEVQALLDKASEKAKSRGYVHTLLGRRMRFPDAYRLHKALNGVIQGSAADVMKLKLLDLHRERKYTGLLLRFTVHDEVNGDAMMEETPARVQEILNQQAIPLRVPIRWDVGVGANWAEPDILKLREKKAKAAKVLGL